MESRNKAKWYQTSIGIIVMLVLFFPVGLYFMWRHANWHKNIKIGITAILFLMVLTRAFGGDSQPNNTQSPQNEVSKVSEAETTPTPTLQLSEEEEIKAIITSSLEGKNNLNQAKLKGIELSGDKENGWKIVVNFNPDDNLTSDLRKKGIENEMVELYKSLYTSNKNIENIGINAYFPLTDKYGKTSDEPIYITNLNKEEASQINWQADEAMLKGRIIPSVWKTLFIHPDFR